MCLTKVVNRHFSWSADGLRRAVLISNIIYLSSPPCGTYTNTVTESDRKFHTLFHHAPAINLIPTATSLGPSLSIPSLKSMVTQCCGVVCRIHLNIFILDSMNLHKLCSVLTAKSRATGLTHMHVLVHTHTYTHTNNPIIQASGKGFVWYHWNLTVIYGEGESHYTLIHTKTESKVTGPNMGTKKGYRFPNKAILTAVHAVLRGQHRINEARQMNSADSTTWINWLLSITRFLWIPWIWICLLPHSMNPQWLPENVCGSEKSKTDFFAMSRWAQVYIFIYVHTHTQGSFSCWSHFLLHYHCGFVRIMNSEWPDTPFLPVQVCPPHFCVGMLYVLSLTAQVRTTHSSWLHYKSGEHKAAI